ncbi:TetR/AcrR family transcriptional regulator [Nesterenkonia ebinurensis]|uniref:TetR/AcrR family transcriptional regulator n=1 Tax=Nesterenkonia ebinurensis TaxID=2608252 RepID=UPI00168A6978|nr:TetR family transcriptional regulator [Nesterenkonia ebinurensis]
MGEGGESSAPRRGPRPTDTAWREQILDAARREFGEHGYQAATVRRIGHAAGVDPKLVHYYFGTKEELFTTTIAETFRARGFPALLAQASSPPADSAGTRYLLAVLTALEDDTLGPGFIGLVRNLGTHEESRRIFVRFVTGELIEQLAPRLEADFAEARVTLAGSQLLGLVMARYVLKVPPLASLSIQQVAQTVGPTLDRYLFDGLPLHGNIEAGNDQRP